MTWLRLINAALVAATLFLAVLIGTGAARRAGWSVALPWLVAALMVAWFVLSGYECRGAWFGSKDGEDE